MTAPYSGGMYHPGVIQQPGAGDALAGGLTTVLAAFLQKNQLDQQHQAFQAELANKQADTEKQIQLAKMTGAETDKYKQDIKDAQEKSDLAKEQHTLMTQGLGFVASNSQALRDPKAWGQAITDGLQHGTIKPEHIPYLMDMAGKTAETMGKLADAQKGQSDATTAAANAGVAGPMASATLAEKNAQTANLNAEATKNRGEAAQLKQKADDAEKQKYLLASDNDPMKAYSKYLMDKKLYGKAGASDPSLAMQFQALAKSPVTGLKQTDLDRATKMYMADPQVKATMTSAGAYSHALGALKSAADGNGAATGSAYINVIKAIDQPTNLRYQVLSWAKDNIDPSFGNDIKKGFDKKFHGTIPPNVVHDMYTHIVAMRASDKQQLQTQYDFYHAKYPEATFKDPDTAFGKDEDFQLNAPGAAAPDPLTAQIIKKYGLTPR